MKPIDLAQGGMLEVVLEGDFRHEVVALCRINGHRVNLHAALFTFLLHRQAEVVRLP
jgi:hypothetical protein